MLNISAYYVVPSPKNADRFYHNEALFFIVKTVIAAKTQKESYLQGVAREQKLEGHIMISYQWSHQKTLLMVKEALVRNGFKVCLINGYRNLIAISNENYWCL